MAETPTRRDPSSDAAIALDPDTEQLDPLQDSLDELARLADSLVDNLTADDPQELEASPEDDSRESRRAAMSETLKALENLIEDPSPPPVSAEVQLDGDRGEDISAHLDARLAPEALSDEPASRSEPTSPAEPAPLVSDPAPSLARTAEHAAVPPIPISPGVETRTVMSVPAKPRRRATTISWLLVVIALLGTAAGGYWYMQPSPTEAPVMLGEVPMPDPPVVFTKPPHQQPDLPDTELSATRLAPASAQPAAQPARSRPAPPRRDEATVAHVADATEPPAPGPELPPTQPVIEPAKPETDGATVSYASTTAETPPEPATPPRTTEPVIEPAAPLPDEVTVSYAGASIGATLIPAPIETPSPVAFEPETETPSPVESDDGPVEFAAAEPVELVAVPADQPPVVTHRVEPIYDSNSIGRGETQTVVLRVLVNESGQVVRVVVDESVSGSNTEVAAINAVLRWSYSPALENGEPVRRWTTERFEFRRRHD